jgi:hypothetical protein
MIRRTLVLVSLVALSSVGLSAQGGRGAAPPPPPLEPGASQADVDKALVAAPAQLRGGAMVIKWNPADWSYTTLRKGTNRLVCFDSSGFAGQLPYSVECSSIANLDRIKQNLTFEAQAAGDNAKLRALVADAEKNGTRPKPEFGSIWFHIQGKDEASGRSHTTVAVPGATAQSMGIPDNGKMNGIWIMDAGTSAAHLMLPGF